jgi:hypothetical protein
MRAKPEEAQDQGQIALDPRCSVLKIALRPTSSLNLLAFHEDLDWIILLWTLWH